MSKVVSWEILFTNSYFIGKGNILFQEDTYLHTLYLFEIKFTNSMAAKLFWEFGRNEGANKKIRKHQSFKEY